jgi:hypothetical protein
MYLCRSQVETSSCCLNACVAPGRIAVVLVCLCNTQVKVEIDFNKKKLFHTLIKKIISCICVY